MLKNCIILNGPPGVGKDTIASHFTDLLRPKFTHLQFKDQLYIDTALYFDVDVHSFVTRASDRELKEQPWKPLTLHTDKVEVLSPRQALIHVSENYIKPTFGEDYFGNAAATACLRANAQHAVFSDGGFGSEIPPLQDIYERVWIVHLLRDGFTFAGDSRRYIEGFDNTFSTRLIPGNPEHTVDVILQATGIDHKRKKVAA